MIVLRKSIVWSLAAAALLLPVPAARADHIDKKLIEVAPELVRALHDKGFKNVGVLKFLVKKGGGPLDGNAGPLNLNMAERVQNALILGLEDAHRIGVIADATQVASKADPRYSVRSADARKALFGHKYPLAWGKEQVTADAFVTGSVDLSVDMKTVTVELGYFDRTGAIKPLKKFDVRTDRSILADSGQSFTVAGRSLKKKRSLTELDEEAAESASEADGGKTVDKQLAEDKAAPPVKFEIVYNGAAQPITPDEASPGEMRVATPSKGDKVTFNLTNTSPEKVAVVLKVNGVNTIEREEEEDALCLKWVLAPGKAYTIRGFYSQGKLDLFQVLDDEESAARMADAFGAKPRAGYIDLSVFHEGSGDEQMAVGRTLRNSASRGLPAPASAAQAQKQLLSGLGAKPVARKGRGLVVEGGGTEDKTLESDELKNLQQIYQLHVGYYKPAK